MRINILNRAALVRKMYHSAFPRVVVRHSHLRYYRSTRLSILDGREPSLDLRKPTKGNCGFDRDNQQSTCREYQGKARFSRHLEPPTITQTSASSSSSNC